MRNLTNKQKKVLDAFFESQKNKAEYVETPFTQGRYGLSVEDVPMNVYEQLEKINDTEILHQEVNRYLMDKSTEYIHKR